MTFVDHDVDDDGVDVVAVVDVVVVAVVNNDCCFSLRQGRSVHTIIYQALHRLSNM